MAEAAMIPMGHKDKPWEEAQPKQRAESAPRLLGTGNLVEHRDERAMEGWDDRVQGTGGCHRPQGLCGLTAGQAPVSTFIFCNDGCSWVAAQR